MGACCASGEKKEDDAKWDNKENQLEEVNRTSQYEPPNPKAPEAAASEPTQQDDEKELLKQQVAMLTKILEQQQQEREKEKDERSERSMSGTVSSQPADAASNKPRRRKGSRKNPPPPPPDDPPSVPMKALPGEDSAGWKEDSAHNLLSPPMQGGSTVKTASPLPPPPPPPPLQPPREDGSFAFDEKPYKYSEHTDTPPPDLEQPHTGRVRTLMLIGETGSGKSTLINAMANYAAGVQYNDKVRYRLVHETQRDQSQSQTQHVSSYHVWCPKHSFTMRLIDTPGFGDTSGVERDEVITKDIYEFLQKEEEIHGVCFVAAASLPRLTVTQQYIINKVLTMFGMDAASNIFLLVTFADGKKAQVLNAIKASGFPYQENSCFHFNNSALFAQGEDRNEYSRNFWQMGVHSLEKFFLNLSTKEPFNLNKTKDVIATQKKLQNYVASITPQVTIGLSKIDNLKRILDDIKVNRDKINENKDYCYSETIPKVERMLKQPGTYNTQCLKCSYNCHHDCTRSNDSDKQYCCAMDTEGFCTVCPDKCHWSDHANLDYYFDWSVQTVKRTYDTKKLQLTAAKDGLSRSEALKSSILSELQQVYDTVHNLMTSIHQAHSRLDEIALRPTNLQFADYLNLLIEQEKLHKRPGFEGRIQQLHFMLEQAKIQRNIVEKKYDPITEWKSNVEKELQNLGGWEEPPEPAADEGTEEDSGSDTDTTSTDSTVDIDFKNAFNSTNPVGTAPQHHLLPAHTAQGTPLPTQRHTDIIVTSTPVRTPSSVSQTPTMSLPSLPSRRHMSTPRTKSSSIPPQPSWATEGGLWNEGTDSSPSSHGRVSSHPYTRPTRTPPMSRRNIHQNWDGVL